MKKLLFLILIFIADYGYTTAQVIPVITPAPVKKPTTKAPAKKKQVPAAQTTTQTAVETPAPKPDILGIPMVFVKGGSFDMGSNKGEDREKPVHRVTVSSFNIGKTEVTQAQWRAIMGNNPSNFQNCDDCPVENVSWYDAQDFIDKLNQKTGKTYRLPTEAEWEFAAKGGNSSRGYAYSGDDELYRVAWFKDISNNQTHPAGQKKANELGIYDMSGNVCEWCQDWYAADYYANSPASDPHGPTSGSFRVLRGGGWEGAAQTCPVAGRFSDSPGYREINLGFRLVLVP